MISAHSTIYCMQHCLVRRCKSGCKCTPMLVDGHHDEKESQTYLAALQVTQHKQCMLSVKVEKETRSGSNKFKVSGVMLAEPRNMGYIFVDNLWQAEALY